MAFNFQVPVIVVLTKTDKIPKNNEEEFEDIIYELRS